MFRLLLEPDRELNIPGDADTLEGFRRWALSDDYPEKQRIDFIAGDVVVDAARTELYTHAGVMNALLGDLLPRVRDAGLGELFFLSVRVSSLEAGWSVTPDLVFVSYEAYETGRVTLTPKPGGRPDQYVELVGAPDLLVEVVSDVSVARDTEQLPAAYFAAGVREFWRVDARSASEPTFVIEHRTRDRFAPAPSRGAGWRTSSVFGTEFRLERRSDRRRPHFTLATRSLR